MVRRKSVFRNQEKVFAVHFHPTKSRWVALCTENGYVKIIESKLNKVVKQFKVIDEVKYNFKIYILSDNNHFQQTLSVEFHPTESTFICGGEDGSIYLYDFSSGKRITKLEGHKDSIIATTFHQAVPIFLSASDDRTIRLWDSKSNEELVCFSGHKGDIFSAKLHPKKNLIVSCSYEYKIKLWNFDKLVEKIGVGSKGKVSNEDVYLVKSVDTSGYLYYASFHPHSNLIFSCDYEKNVKIWSYSDQDLTQVKIWKDAENNLQCVEVHPKTGNAVSCSSDGKFKVWDDSGNCVDSYTTKDEWQYALCCHKTLPLVALGCKNSLVILVLNKQTG